MLTPGSLPRAALTGDVTPADDTWKAYETQVWRAAAAWVGDRKLQLMSQCWFLGYAPKSWLGVQELIAARDEAKRWQRFSDPALGVEFPKGDA